MYTIYKVKDDETLEMIAKKNEIKLEELLLINGFSNNHVLKEGDLIIIPNNEKQIYFKYIVQKGDTLYSISNKYNMKPDVLAKLNGIDENGFLYINQELIVPKKGVELYITSEGETIKSLKNKFGQNYNRIIDDNKYIYLLPEQVIVTSK